MSENRITKERVSQALDTLNRYRAAKAELDSRILEEEKWWRLRHRETSKMPRDGSDPCGREQPASAWLFNSIANKHADAMDSYPELGVLPRERGDEKEAELLSKIIPAITDKCGFEETYSDNWWYKLKHGTAAYGVFWSPLGDDITISRIDLLNLYWQPNVSDIQESDNLFILSAESTESLRQRYPNKMIQGDGGDIKSRDYNPASADPAAEVTTVIDWYYKTADESGRSVLHLCKLAGETVLFATENDELMRETGLYDHGLYPVVLDRMYPLEGTPCGFGMISVMKSPQSYIDSLSRVVLENAAMSSRVRYFAKNGGGISEKELLDWSKPIVHVEGSLDEERIRRIEVPSVSSNALNVLQMKIDELKETSGSRDFSQGSVAGGVTAASAIAALQEAGNKTSRDIIAASYRAYTKIGELIIGLIKQFYGEERCFRIVGEDGRAEFVSYAYGMGGYNAGLGMRNAKLKSVTKGGGGYNAELGMRNAELGSVTAGDGGKSDRLSPLNTNDRLSPLNTKEVSFDIVIKPQKRTAYSKLSQNELAKELYRLGFFNPENAVQALSAIELMDFDGKAKIRELIVRGQNQSLFNTKGGENYE